MKKPLFLSLLAIVVLIPATLFLGTYLTGRMHYLTSTLVVVETMLPFFFLFEGRKPQARELSTIAVMCALAVVSRVAVQIPDFKPILGIIMITGIAFGAETGFMTGAVSAFASNFFFSQGPWTPWQMLAYGMAGFLAGLLFHRRRPFPDKPWKQRIVWTVSGFLVAAFVVGLLLDTCTLFTTGTAITWAFAGMVYTAGMIHNILNGITTAVTMAVLAPFLLTKLDRVKTKYGIMQQ